MSDIKDGAGVCVRRSAPVVVAATAWVLGSAPGCGGDDVTGADTGDANDSTAVWRCADITGSLGPVGCWCELRPPAEHTPDYNTDRCVMSDLCCQLSDKLDECGCEPTSEPSGSSCEYDANYAGAHVVSQCPPTASDVEAVQVQQAAPPVPTCLGGDVSCDTAQPTCSGVPGSCPTCYHCLSWEGPAVCVGLDDLFLSVGSPTCSDLPTSQIPAESAEPACMVLRHSGTVLNGEFEPIVACTCIDPSNGAAVAGAIANCDALPDARVSCHGLRPVCVLAADLTLPDEQQTVLGRPACGSS